MSAGAKIWGSFRGLLPPSNSYLRDTQDVESKGSSSLWKGHQDLSEGLPPPPGHPSFCIPPFAAGYQVDPISLLCPQVFGVDLGAGCDEQSRHSTACGALGCFWGFLLVPRAPPPSAASQDEARTPETPHIPSPDLGDCLEQGVNDASRQSLTFPPSSFTCSSLFPAIICMDACGFHFHIHGALMTM